MEGIVEIEVAARQEGTPLMVTLVTYTAGTAGIVFWTAWGLSNVDSDGGSGADGILESKRR